MTRLEACIHFIEKEHRIKIARSALDTVVENALGVANAKQDWLEKLELLDVTPVIAVRKAVHAFKYAWDQLTQEWHTELLAGPIFKDNGEGNPVRRKIDDALLFDELHWLTEAIDMYSAGYERDDRKSREVSNGLTLEPLCEIYIALGRWWKQSIQTAWAPHYTHDGTGKLAPHNAAARLLLTAAKMFDVRYTATHCDSARQRFKRLGTKTRKL